MFSVRSFTSQAIPAIRSTASGVMGSKTPSVASSSVYCRVRDPCGSVRIRTKSSRVRGSSSTRMGNLPCSSGIRSDGLDIWIAPAALHMRGSFRALPFCEKGEGLRTPHPFPADLLGEQVPQHLLEVPLEPLPPSARHPDEVDRRHRALADLDLHHPVRELPSRKHAPHSLPRPPPPIRRVGRRFPRALRPGGAAGVAL